MIAYTQTMIAYTQTLEVYCSYEAGYSQVWCSRDNRSTTPYYIAVGGMAEDRPRVQHASATEAHLELLRLRLKGYLVPAGLIKRLRREAEVERDG